MTRPPEWQISRHCPARLRTQTSAVDDPSCDRQSKAGPARAGAVRGLPITIEQPRLISNGIPRSRVFHWRTRRVRRACLRQSRFVHRSGVNLIALPAKLLDLRFALLATTWSRKKCLCARTSPLASTSNMCRAASAAHVRSGGERPRHPARRERFHEPAARRGRRRANRAGAGQLAAQRDQVHAERWTNRDCRGHARTGASSSP